MSDAGARAGIDRLLERKAQLDSRLAAQPPLAERLRELRSWQAQRLARTYADQRADPRRAAAMGFFLSDLYGPQDFSRRDRDLSQAAAVLRHTLPPSARKLLELAMELAVLSEDLDLAMTGYLPAGPISAETYAQAYRAVGRPEARRRQIELILEIGARLGRTVRIPLIGLALRAARAPARIAGLGALQDFFERGFAAFRRMPSAAPLLDAVRDRETAFMTSLLGEAPSSAAPALGHRDA